MVTLTLSKTVGSCKLTKSDVRQVRVVAERLVPKIDTHVPGAMAPPELAALTTPFAEIAGCTGADCTLNVTGTVCAIVGGPGRRSVVVPLDVPGAMVPLELAPLTTPFAEIAGCTGADC